MGQKRPSTSPFLLGVKWGQRGGGEAPPLSSRVANGVDFLWISFDSLFQREKKSRGGLKRLESFFCLIILLVFFFANSKRLSSAIFAMLPAFEIAIILMVGFI